jgi:hypothetical protein
MGRLLKGVKKKARGFEIVSLHLRMSVSPCVTSVHLRASLSVCVAVVLRKTALKPVQCVHVIRICLQEKERGGSAAWLDEPQA